MHNYQLHMRAVKSYLHNVMIAFAGTKQESSMLSTLTTKQMTAVRGHAQ